MSTTSKAPDDLDDSDLRALDEAIAQVLASDHALHRLIDGKNHLDRTLWSKAIELGCPFLRATRATA